MHIFTAFPVRCVIVRRANVHARRGMPAPFLALNIAYWTLPLRIGGDVSNPLCRPLPRKSYAPEDKVGFTMLFNKLAKQILRRYPFHWPTPAPWDQLRLPHCLTRHCFLYPCSFFFQKWWKNNRFLEQPSVYARHVDSPSLGFSLSSHRQLYIGLVFSSRFIDLIINKKRTKRCGNKRTKRRLFFKKKEETRLSVLLFYSSVIKLSLCFSPTLS